MSIIQDDSIHGMVLDQARRSVAAEVATKFLNGHRFKQSVRFTDGEIQDNLELSCLTLPSSIQEILNTYQSNSELTLKTPSPSILPITVSPICNNENAIIIPNLKLDVHSLVSDHAQYELEGVLCRINHIEVVFVRCSSSNEWYYNQDKHPLKKAAPELSQKINQIISSKSIQNSLALLDSVYFIISPIFFNAVRYFYKKLFMSRLQIGQVIQSSCQCAIIRWFGVIEEQEVIGLESIGNILSGYTDGLCPIDNHRYFSCPDGHGYYVFKENLLSTYKIVDTTTTTANKPWTGESPERLNLNKRSSSTTHKNFSQPTTSNSSPLTSRSQDKTSRESTSSCGILSRLTSENKSLSPQTSRSHRSNQNFSSQTSTSPNDSISKIYRADNYRSTAINENLHATDYMKNEDSFQFINHEDFARSSPPVLGNAHCLDTWTFEQLKLFITKKILPTHRISLSVINDQSNVQQLIDDQINGSSSYITISGSNDISIEIVKLFESVQSIFPSGIIRLHNKQYLLLAILCSNSQCAYIRTKFGWAYIDPDGQKSSTSSLINQLSRMIDENSNNFHHQSEQCQHVLKNAAFLYYRLL